MSKLINYPKEIKLGEYIHKYKCKLKVGYSYRYKSIKHWNIIIIIELDEIKKYLNKEQNI